MAAAHWEAVRVLDAVGAVAQLNFPEAWTKLAESLAICMAEGPLVLAADEGLHSLYARVSEHTTPVRWIVLGQSVSSDGCCWLASL